MAAIPRPRNTPDHPGLLWAHSATDTATSATGSRSQLMVPARITPGASATMAASHGRLRWATAVASTATIQQASNSRTLTLKNQDVSPAGVSRAAT